MPDPAVTVTETEIEDEAEPEPTGLVDPRAIHPGPGDVQPGPQAGAMPGSEKAPGLDAASPDPGGPKVEVAEGTGLVDPRGSLPGPDLGP